MHLTAMIISRNDHATIYPAVQNILLVCRALGLGSCLTTFQFFFEDEVKQLLGVSTDLEISGVAADRLPEREVRTDRSRRPVHEVLRWNRFAG